MLEEDDGLLSRCSFVYVGLRQPSGFLPALYSHHQPTLSVIDGQHSSCQPKPRQEAHPPHGAGGLAADRLDRDWVALPSVGDRHRQSDRQLLSWWLSVELVEVRC